MGKLVDNPVDEIYPLTLNKLSKGWWGAYHEDFWARGICPRDAALNLAKLMEALNGEG